MAHLPLLCFTLLLLMHTSITIGNPELAALMELKSALDPQDHFLSSWSSEGDPCNGSFEGVACNGEGKVVNISLQGKGLTGYIAPAVAQLRSLTGLYLHYNAISGRIPSEVGSLRELTDLYLNENNLSGSIPDAIGTMAALQVLQLCCNQLTGSIPTQLGLLQRLDVLVLKANRLTGAIPASLGDLTQLTRLDLSFNELFGSIPLKLAQAPELQVLDLRNNSLSGVVPSDLKRLNGGFQYGNNMDLCGTGFSSLRVCTSADVHDPDRPEPYGLQDHPLSADVNAHCNKTHCPNSSKSSTVAVAIGISAVAIASIITGVVAVSWYHHQKRKLGTAASGVSDHRVSVDHPKDPYRRSVSPLVSLEYSNGWDPLADGRSGVGFSEEVSQSFRFNLEEVESATQYFSEVNLLGRRNLSATYKGMLRDGTAVVVKSISKTSCRTEEAEFLKGLKLLALLRHENLVRLRGFCCSTGRGECFLVYNFVTNGKLSQYLDVKGDDKGRVLDWPTRVSIIKGIAKGIEYLHSSRANKPSLVHQNISADRILMDDRFNPLITGSGLHNLLADDVIFSTLKASAAMGYLAPEYTTIGRFTEKSDIYAFGVVLFQVLTGKKAIAQLQAVAEAGDLDKLIDQNLQGNFSRTEAAKLTDIAMVCTSEAPNERPAMQLVAQELERIC